MKLNELFLISGFLLVYFLTGCEKFSLPNHTYDYFVMKEAPEIKTWYPEDSLVFVFNMEVDPETIDSIKVTYENGEKLETPCSITVSGMSVVISKFPSDSVITISFKPGLKSVSHHPLVQIIGNQPVTRTSYFSYPIGSGFPVITSLVPSMTDTSASMILEFSSSVNFDTGNITPAPTLVHPLSTSHIFLNFTVPPSTISLSGFTTPVRTGIIPDIVLSFTSLPEVSDEITITDSSNDHQSSVSFSGESLVIAEYDNTFTICEDGSCSFTITQLQPDTSYTFHFTLYTFTGEKSESVTVRTTAPRATAMISEIMHTPAMSPEKSWEFVELYNGGSLPFSLENCMIDDKNDGKGIDPLIPNQEGDFILAPGELALIVAKDSLVPSSLAENIKIFFVDDTTIADAGLTSTESVEIFCPEGETQVLVDQYDGLFKNTTRGYSVIIDPFGAVCSSKNEGGSPGKIERCE